MALATVYPFSQFVILVGDGATPEVFDDPCGLTTRGFTRTANMNDTNIPDCADPDKPSWLGRDVVSYQAAITGAGVVAKESMPIWEGWWKDGTTKNIQIMLGKSADLDKMVWQGPAKLQELAITAERGQKVNMNINIVSDGEIALTTTLPLAARESVPARVAA